MKSLVTRLNIDITRINDCALLLSGLQGEANANAVNALMQRFGDETSIVSEYVVKALSKKVDMEFVNSASRVMTANPVWQGWVFELRFFVLCKTHTVAINLKHPKESLVWEKSKILEVKDAECIDKGTLSNKTWIFPKWNQSCFDALYFHEYGRLDFVQITTANSHVYK